MTKFVQIGCREGASLDTRQAKAVLRHKPDIVLFEYPQENKTPDTVFNDYPPNKKPKREFNALIQKLKKASTKYPWVASDIAVFKNIEKLWESGKQVYIYFIDAPSKITSTRLEENNTTKRHLAHQPLPKIQKYLWWWEKIYLRETYMTKHIQWVFKKHKKNIDGLKVLVFLEKFHWLHVQFRLKNLSQKTVYKYYFGGFKK
jgi:hypothetical protein